MNIIFLDIDGVLNSLAYFQSLDKSKQSSFNDISDFHLKMLAKIYHSVQAKIVLSSTWRYLDNPNEIETYKMYEYLTAELNRYSMQIIDKTPVIHGNRPLEIDTWAKENKCKTFVSLDDDFGIEQYNKYGIGFNLIHTTYFCYNINIGGLQQEHVDEALKKFKIMNNN